MESEATPPATPPTPADEVSIEGARGTQTFQLRQPSSLAIRYETMYAIAENEQRAGACALGLCVSKIGHAVGAYDSKPLDYGGRVIEYLLAQEVDYLEILRAGRLAWAFLCHGLPRAKAAKAAEDFFGQKPEGSTST